MNARNNINGPAENLGVPEAAARILALLDERKMAYEVRTHAPIFTVAEGKALALPAIEQAVKSMLVTDDKEAAYYFFALPLDEQLDLKDVRRRIASRRLCLAKPERLQELLGAAPGAVSPFSLLDDHERRVKIYFDARLAKRGVAVPLGGNTATIWLACSDLVRLLAESGHEAEFLELGNE